MNRTATALRKSLIDTGYSDEQADALVAEQIAKGAVTDDTKPSKPLAGTLRKALGEQGFAPEQIEAMVADQIAKGHVAEGEPGVDFDLDGFDKALAEVAEIAKAGGKPPADDDPELDDELYNEGTVEIHYPGGEGTGTVEKALSAYARAGDRLADATERQSGVLAKAMLAQGRLLRQIAQSEQARAADAAATRAQIDGIYKALRLESPPRAQSSGGDVIPLRSPQDAEPVADYDKVLQKALTLQKADGITPERQAELASAVAEIEAQGNPGEIAKRYGIAID